jgi:AraC-like DNA-binding protein
MGSWIRGLRDPVVARALALIHNEYARSWTLDTLARASGASRATLARNFVAAVGTTPMRFLTERRLSVAEGLMRRTAMTLEEIAAEVGYGSAYSLSKAFKREFGAAPAHYVRA